MIADAALAVALMVVPRDAPPDAARPAIAATIAQAASWLPRAQDAFRHCVVARESGGNPRARNRASSASGKYQYLDRQWRRGLSFQVRDRLVAFGMPQSQARELRAWLAARPIYQWPERYQDVGFAATLNYHAPWSGWRHWASGGRCDRLVPR